MSTSRLELTSAEEALLSEAARQLDVHAVRLRRGEEDLKGIRPSLQKIETSLREAKLADQAESYRRQLLDTNEDPAVRLRKAARYLKHEAVVLADCRRSLQVRLEAGRILHSRGVRLGLLVGSQALYVPEFQKSLPPGQCRLYLPNMAAATALDAEAFRATLSAEPEPIATTVTYRKFLDFVGSRAYRTQNEPAPRLTHCFECARALNSHFDPTCEHCSRPGSPGLICVCGRCLCHWKTDIALHDRFEREFLNRLG